MKPEAAWHHPRATGCWYYDLPKHNLAVVRRIDSGHLSYWSGNRWSASVYSHYSRDFPTLRAAKSAIEFWFRE